MAFTGTHHKAISVTSGYWAGAPGYEIEVINTSGAIASGTVGTNAIIDANVTTAKIASGAITTAKIAPSTVTLAQVSPQAFDYGTIGASGHSTAVSTRLSSIATVVANNYGPLATANSGMFVHTSWSGHTINIYRYAVDGSAAISGVIAWQAWSN